MTDTAGGAIIVVQLEITRLGFLCAKQFRISPRPCGERKGFRMYRVEQWPLMGFESPMGISSGGDNEWLKIFLT